MGWSDKAIARARLAAAKAAEVSKDLLSEADQALQSARPGYGEFMTTVAGAAAEARDGASRKFAEAGATKSGTAIGDATRAGLGKLGQLPVISAPMDASKARQGLEQLTKACREQPDEPMHAVRLVEALDRVHQDLVLYRTARAVVDPIYLIHRQVIVTAAQLGKAAGDPLRVALLKRAFVQSRQQLAVRSDDAIALHVLSRVYLAQADTKHSALAAALSYRTDSANALPLVTLARAHLVVGDVAEASKVAQRAVQEGADYANEILAQVVLKTPGRPQRELAAAFERLRGRVTADGRAAYVGCALDAAGAWHGFKSVQAERARKLAGNVKEAGRGLGS